MSILTPKHTNHDGALAIGTVRLVATAALIIAAFGVVLTLGLGLLYLNQDDELRSQNGRLAQVARENRHLINVNERAIRRLDRQDARLAMAIQRINRLEHPTAADFRRFLHRLLRELRGPENARLRRAIRRAINNKGVRPVGGNPPPGQP